VTDAVSEAIRLAKRESNFRAINHLRRTHELSEDDWFRIQTELPINGGRKPSEITAAKEAHRKKWWRAVRARMKAEGVRGPVHRERIARELFPQFDTFPDDSEFVWTSAIHVAEKGP
jgi:hypothetical protein